MKTLQSHRSDTRTTAPDDAAAVQLLESLVSIPSVSTRETDASHHLARTMASLGLDACVDEAGNAVGIRGDASPTALEIMLLGHIDTVPGDIPVRIEGDTLHGRGSVDAKGPLCALSIAAARAKLPANIRVVVVGAVEEECASGKGARHMAATRRPHACIIGEPSHWDGLTLGYKGRMLCDFTLTRDAAHTARPEPSAAEIATDFFHRIRADADARNASANNPGHFFTVQPTLRSINTRTDGMHETVTMCIGWRLPPRVCPHEIEASVRSLSPEHERATLTFIGHEVAHQADRSNPVARALATAIRAEGGTPTPRLKTGTSDMNVVAPHWDCPMTAYGPGDSTLDHTPEERISISEYLRSIRVLTRAVESLAAELSDERSE